MSPRTATRPATGERLVVRLGAGSAAATYAVAAKPVDGAATLASPSAVPGLDLEGVDLGAALVREAAKGDAGEVVAVPLPSGATVFVVGMGDGSPRTPPRCLRPGPPGSLDHRRGGHSYDAGVVGVCRRRARCCRGAGPCRLHLHAALRAQALDAAHGRAAGPPARDRFGGLRARSDDGREHPACSRPDQHAVRGEDARLARRPGRARPCRH